MGKYQSGQMGQTVNLLAYAFGGSNPPPSIFLIIAGWSSLEARRAHNPKVIGSNPIPATL